MPLTYTHTLYLQTFSKSQPDTLSWIKKTGEKLKEKLSSIYGIDEKIEGKKQARRSATEQQIRIERK